MIRGWRFERLIIDRITAFAVLAVLAASITVIPAKAAAPGPVPTDADVAYGTSPHQLMDIYLPKEGKGPFPVLLWYGGIWQPSKHVPDLRRFLPAGVAVIGVETRTLTDGMNEKATPPVSYVMNDACRAVQFVRLNAAKWRLDPAKIAVGGGSQGALPALFVGCARDRANPKSDDPVERVSTKVTGVAAYRSQPTIDPVRMQEWVPGVKWGAPALGCSFEESLKRRAELLPMIQSWSPDALLHKGAAPIYFENNWGLTQPENVGETDYKVHSPAWALGFQKLADRAGAVCHVKYPGHPTARYKDIWDFLVQELAPASDGIDNYEPGPDSRPKPGVPKGKTFSFEFTGSKIFPGTSRSITVYVPAQYTGEKPACVYVGLDGLGFGVPAVFDNLIHQGEMPVTIAIGVSSGSVASGRGKDDPRFNRSFEFDGLNDSLARCFDEEIVPEVEKRGTPDGRPIKLSRDPNDRCAGGGSTGGVAAFTMAWERPDKFRRVFSAIGTFVGMRGADRYPVLVRKTEPKPIRVFQQDGENDQWMGGPEVGDWWMSNQTLDRALEFAGYEHQHAWGTGPHSGKHATAIFPGAMRFLWKGWPKPIEPQTRRTQNLVLKAIIDPDASWQQVSEAGTACDHLAVNPAGEIFYHDLAVKHTSRLDACGSIHNEPAISWEKPFGIGADGRAVSIDEIGAGCVAVTSSGRVYATDSEAGKVWMINERDGRKTMLDEGLKRPTGIALSPDGLWLAVVESRSHWGFSYRLRPDRTVELKQPFYWFHVPDSADDSGAGGMCMDRDGRSYVATRMGVQVFDRNGRSRAILPLPAGEATSVSFGGAKFETLFVTSGGKLFKRHMKSVGAPPFLPPFKLPPWGAG